MVNKNKTKEHQKIFINKEKKPKFACEQMCWWGCFSKVYKIRMQKKSQNIGPHRVGSSLVRNNNYLPKCEDFLDLSERFLVGDNVRFSSGIMNISGII